MKMTAANIPCPPWNRRLPLIWAVLRGKRLELEWEMKDADIPNLYARLGNYIRWHVPKKAVTILKDTENVESLPEQLQLGAEQMGENIQRVRESREL